MVTKNQIFNLVKNDSPIASTTQGGAGYDNPRENIDPHIKTKVVSTQEINVSRLNEIRYTKNFSSIQAALDSLPSTGGKVHIDAGTYNLSTSLEINKSNVILEGEGDASKIFLNNNSDTNVINVTVDNVTIKNILIDCNGTNQSGLRSGIKVTTQDNVNVEDCHIINARTAAIDYTTVTNSLISGNYIYNSVNDGIKLRTTCLSITIIGNHIDTVGALGIACGDYGAASSHLLVANNIVVTTGDNGIDFNGTFRSVIHGNNVRNCTVNGICLDSAPSNIVSNNMVYNTDLAGIFLNNDTGGNADRCLVIGNRVTHATANYCFELEADNCMVVDNYFYDSIIADVFIYAASANTVFLNNYYTTLTDNSATTIKGINAAITTGDLVGKTATFVKGVLTGYA